MHIIALDLGTKTGFAEYADGEAITQQWLIHHESKRTKTHRNGRRIDALLHRLNFMLSAPEYMPDVIYYEKVMAHRGKNGKTNIYAAHCYGALEGALQYWCLLHGVRLESAGVTEIKKAFGNGSLSKKGMQKSAMILWGIDNISEDEADALGLLWLACKQEGVIK